MEGKVGKMEKDNMRRIRKRKGNMEVRKEERKERRKDGQTDG